MKSTKQNTVKILGKMKIDLIICSFPNNQVVKAISYPESYFKPYQLN